ncbi:putative major facilitator superfamily, MFS transporter superfamily [Septoria linicola]|nr:putative major facilitator superfamily, MFS transporter superfamily [Septoria linicola]
MATTINDDPTKRPVMYDDYDPEASQQQALGIEKVGSPSSHNSDAEDAFHWFTPEEGRKIKHKIDRRLVVMLGVMYCVSLMDRTNLSNAAIAGMRTELALVGNNRYSIITLVFFITYTLLQPLATPLTRKIGPRMFLSTICTLWGIVMIGMGVVNNWQSLVGLRVVLGIFEAGYFPGAVYLLSTWFVRYDVGKRYAVFYMIGSLASAAAGILAYGLMQMEGVAGYGGWRWIFIMEGIITVLIGIAGYIFLVGFPDQQAWKSWGFLNEREVRYVVACVDRDRGDATVEPFSMKRFLTPALDIKVWGFAMIFLCTTTIAYALAFFLPIILRLGMGFSIAESQCLVAPPYAFAAVVMYVESWFGDRYHVRGPQLTFNAIVAIIGLALMGWTTAPGVRYFGVFVCCAGVQANVVMAMSFQANNIRGQWKRAFCSASLVGFGGIGGIAGSLVFREQDLPTYRPGLWACMTACIITVVITSTLQFFFWRANKAADRGEKEIEGGGPTFRYTL